MVKDSLPISIVLPCYNEEGNIAPVVHDVQAWLQSEPSLDGTIIVVNDGSKDRSAEVLQSLKQEIPELKVVTREQNGGYGVAVRDGCDAAETEWIVFMDSDGQFDPRDINLLIEHTDDYDFITGRRAHRADPFIRNLFGKVLGAMNVIMLGIWVRDVNCGMKLFRQSTWKRIRPEHGVEKLFNTEMFMRLKMEGIPWKTVNVPHYPRKEGTPTGGSIRVIRRMFDELFALRKALK